MRITDSSGFHFTISRIETDPMRRGDIHAKVQTAGFGFSGTNKSVWFDRLDIDRFIVELCELDRTREGSVTLEAMSPDECNLNFRNYGKLGHLQLDVTIARPVYFYGETDYLRCRVRFEIDSTAFSTIVRELKSELATFPQG